MFHQRESRSNMETTMTTSDRYIRPDWFTAKVFNPLVGWLTRSGISVMGSRELRVAGRKSGQTRTNVVNLLELEGRTYLVAPRGITEWVRNLRAADGHGELRVGRRVDSFRATELDDAAKVPVIRAYLERWAWEVGKFFEGLSADATDDEILAAAPGFPAFAIEVESARP
jgi:deazaflavin-dependent oxidoreductase (nitroreductase family)